MNLNLFRRKETKVPESKDEQIAEQTVKHKETLHLKDDVLAEMRNLETVASRPRRRAHR